MFYLLLPSLEARQGLIEHLRERGILSVFHYLPLHLSEMGIKFGGRPGDCPVTESVSDRLVRIPFYNDLTEKDLAEVVEAIAGFGYLPVIRPRLNRLGNPHGLLREKPPSERLWNPAGCGDRRNMEFLPGSL